MGIPEVVGGILAAVPEGALWERHPQPLVRPPSRGCADVDADCRNQKFRPSLQKHNKIY